MTSNSTQDGIKKVHFRWGRGGMIPQDVNCENHRLAIEHEVIHRVPFDAGPGQTQPLLLRKSHQWLPNQRDWISIGIA